MKHAGLFRREFGSELAPEVVDRMVRHAELLDQWNRVVRLVGEDGPSDWIQRHYAESVAARRFWGAAGGRYRDDDAHRRASRPPSGGAERVRQRAGRRAEPVPSHGAGNGEPALLDIGSGAGFPGLILAALHPERPVTLVESRERKAAFLAEAARELDLPLVRVIRDRFDAELAARLAGTVECATIRGLRLPATTMARLIQALPAKGRLVVWAGRELGPGLASGGLTELCAVDEEMSLPNSRHRRILCMRPLPRG